MTWRSSLFALALALGSNARASDAFPWEGRAQLLRAKDGTTLRWAVRAEGELVVVEGQHPAWHVVHRAKRDGTPLSTVKTRLGKDGRVGTTTRLTFIDGGVEIESDGRPKVRAMAPNLWDGDSLEARLAGLRWQRGQKLHFQVVDSDAKDASVYPMVAEDVGEERCGDIPCHHVKVSLDDWRALFAPTWHFRFASQSGAYLQNDSDGKTFLPLEK